MTAAEPVRVGVVGGGMWATDLHIPLHRSPGSTVLSGVWVRSAEVRQRLRDTGIPVTESYDALLDDCEAVDFAVPPTAQADLACRAAEAGRHVMLEKPSALDPADAQRIADAVARAGVVSTMLLTRRFHPTVRSRLRDIAAQGGRALGVQGAHVHGGLLAGGFVADASTWRHELGLIVDLGPHLLDLGEELAGPIAEVRVREHDGW
ncbi:MAG: Gfo/Idh/MocA family oxidoreductase, partial [Microbacteriaceae bacterium]|nr:Gfo/Idh/MocA family oxidoreductase [Microbacteriaceae bacterium]